MHQIEQLPSHAHSADAILHLRTESSLREAHARPAESAEYSVTDPETAEARGATRKLTTSAEALGFSSENPYQKANHSIVFDRICSCLQQRRRIQDPCASADPRTFFSLSPSVQASGSLWGRSSSSHFPHPNCGHPTFYRKIQR